MALTCEGPTEKDNALKWIEAALLKKPLDKRALTLKASWVGNYGVSSEGLAIAQEVVEASPSFRPGREAKAKNLFVLGRYEETISEARDVLLKRPTGLGWMRYLLVASLYCTGKHEEVLQEADKALSVATDRTVRGYLHLVARKSAVSLKRQRDAVRHSVSACRMVPERQTAKLWLAADLEWAGHSDLAKRFWATELDYSRLTTEECKMRASCMPFLGSVNSQSSA